MSDLRNVVMPRQVSAVQRLLFGLAFVGLMITLRSGAA